MQGQYDGWSCDPCGGDLNSDAKRIKNNETERLRK